MRLHTEATDRRSVRLPSRAVALASPSSPRRRRAGQPRPATRRGRLCDESLTSKPPPARARPPIRATGASNAAVWSNLARHESREAPSRGPRLGPLRRSVGVSDCSCIGLLSAVLAQAEDAPSSSCVQYTPSLPKRRRATLPSPISKPRRRPRRPVKAVERLPPARQAGAAVPTKLKNLKKVNHLRKGRRGWRRVTAAATGQGKPGGSANPGAKNAAHSARPDARASPPLTVDDGGGSSPLVPILIAIAVLAAISVAVVMIRQRRQRNSRGPTAAASPEAN